MAVEADIETALKTELAVTVTDTIHAFWIDDSGAADREDKVTPMVSIKAGVAESTDGVDNVFKMTPVEVVCITNHDKDPNRTALVALYDLVRTALDLNDFAKHMPAGVSLNVIIGGGEAENDGNNQMIRTTLECHTCS